MTEKRESWITIAKAVALVLVIFIHSNPARDSFSSFLTGMVMPAFFVLYGVAHNSGKSRGNLKKYFVGRARALMIPYFVLTLAMLVMYAAFYPFVDFGFTPTDFAFYSIYGNGPLGRVTHLWFLRTMFFAIILFAFVDRFLHNKSIAFRLILLASAPAIGVFLKYGTGVELVPWGMDSVFIALSFMMMGSEIRRYRHLSPWSVNSYVDVIGLTIAFVAYSYFTSVNGFVNIGESLYGISIYNYMFTGILGTYIVCLLSFYAGKYSNRLTRYATSINKVGQEIYEVHPLIIEFNVQFLGGLAIWGALAFYPGAPLLIINFLSAIIISYLIATQVIGRFGVLQLVFMGFRKTKEAYPKPTFPVPEPNGNGNNHAESVEEPVPIEVRNRNRDD